MSSSSSSSPPSRLPFTDAQIAQLIPAFVAIQPGDVPPSAPSNVWAIAGKVVVDGIQLWIFKKLGGLLIIDALE